MLALTSRAHWAAGKTREKPGASFEICEKGGERRDALNDVFEAFEGRHARGMNVGGAKKSWLTCKYRAVSGLVVHMGRVLSALGAEVEPTYSGNIFQN